MKLPRHRLAAILAERSLGMTNSERFAREIAAYLLEQRRTGELGSLLRDIQAYRAEHGIVEVVAYSAHDLSAAVRADVEATVRQVYPDALKIIVTHELAPELLSGVRLELANQQLDLTARAKLNRLKSLTLTGKE